MKQSKSILITGCSSGIGLVTAEILKKRGYRVIASARKPEDVAKLKTMGFECVQLDLTDPSSIKQAVDETLALTGGTLDALFNNAGFLQAGAIEDLTPDLNRSQFETNVFGPMELTRHIVPIMRQQGHGRIIQNSSILGVITLPYYGAYNASKFALEGFSNTLRQELRGTNIYVSIINPGPIVSELRAKAYQTYQSTLATKNTTHQEAYQQMEKSYFKSSKKRDRLAKGPEAVTKKVIHALENPHPKAHYYVGVPAQVMAFLRRVLPDSALDWALSTISFKEGK